MIIKYLALDIGEARIGLALANGVARLAAPMTALSNDEKTFEALQGIIANEHVSQLVAGLPRGLNGQETSQTRYVVDFVRRLEAEVGLPVALQDEALTSVKAEAELEKRGRAYTKGDIDSLSAVFILEDYLLEGVH